MTESGASPVPERIYDKFVGKMRRALPLNFVYRYVGEQAPNRFAVIGQLYVARQEYFKKTPTPKTPEMVELFDQVMTENPLFCGHREQLFQRLFHESR